MYRLLRVICLLCFCFLYGCSSDEDAGTGGDHVWKDTTDTIKRAEEVESKLKEAAELKAAEIEKQTE